MSWTKDDKESALDWFKKNVAEGDRLYCIIRHVSRSGMKRVISVKAMRNNEPVDISRAVAVLTDSAWDRDNYGVVVNGCGMDMCFGLVYDVAGAVFGDGYKLKHDTL
jgi:hypothetical protein